MTVTPISKAGIFAPRPIPLFLERISAGFPSPAEDFVERSLDLNDYCIRHPAATFLVRVRPDGLSMIEAGIFPGDILVVDRSLDAKHGNIVVAIVDGDFTVKQLEMRPRQRLVARNPIYAPIEGETIEIVGVVTHSIRDFRA
jgi:DNA polymerase V